MSKKLKNIIKFPVILAIFFALFFGMSYFGLGMDTNTTMANCPFGGHSVSVCKANPVEHMQEWQGMFAVIPAKDGLVLLATLLILLVASRLQKIFPAPKIPLTDSYINLFYIHRLPIFNQLQEAFSRGILHPKLF